MSNKCFIKKEEPDCIDSIQNDIVSDAGEFKTDGKTICSFPFMLNPNNSIH